MLVEELLGSLFDCEQGVDLRDRQVLFDGREGVALRVRKRLLGGLSVFAHVAAHVVTAMRPASRPDRLRTGQEQRNFITRH
jgi:hypothetical protein